MLVCVHYKLYCTCKWLILRHVDDFTLTYTAPEKSGLDWQSGMQGICLVLRQSPGGGTIVFVCLFAVDCFFRDWPTVEGTAHLSILNTYSWRDWLLFIVGVTGGNRGGSSHYFLCSGEGHPKTFWSKREGCSEMFVLFCCSIILRNASPLSFVSLCLKNICQR